MDVILYGKGKQTYLLFPSFQISYASSDVALCDEIRCPFFYQTAPDDVLQATGITKLVLHFGWTWIGLMVSDNEEGENFVMTLKKEFVRKGVCIAHAEMLPEKASYTKQLQIRKQIMDPSVNVIVIYGATDSLIWLRIALESLLLSRKVLITTSQWDFLSSISYVDTGVTAFHGSLSLALHTNEIVGFRDFLQTISLTKYPDDTFLKYFWEVAFRCLIPSVNSGLSWLPCTGNERLQDLSRFQFDLQTLGLSYNIYKAVYAIAKALHDMNSSQYISKELERRPIQKMHSIKPWKVTTELIFFLLISPH